jgi:hypothetical protein
MSEQRERKTQMHADLLFQMATESYRWHNASSRARDDVLSNLEREARTFPFEQWWSTSNKTEPQQ